jgi:hypothetical protein
VIPVLSAARGGVDAALPTFLRLLKDGAPLIRLRALSRADLLAAAVPLRALAPSLMPALEELAAARAWRLRAAAIALVPRLARLLGADFAADGAAAPAPPQPQGTLVDLVLRWLADPVSAIRDAAARCLRELALAFGAAWAERVLVPRVLGLADAAAQQAAQQAAQPQAANLLSQAPASSAFQLRWAQRAWGGRAKRAPEASVWWSAASVSEVATGN